MTAVTSVFLIIPPIIPLIIPSIIPLINHLIMLGGLNHSNYSVNYSHLFPRISAACSQCLYGHYGVLFTFYIVLMTSKH